MRRPRYNGGLTVHAGRMVPMAWPRAAAGPRWLAERSMDRMRTRGAMSKSRFLVLEFGSKSLKVHRKSSRGDFQKVNVPWRLGHDVYKEGRISLETRQQIAVVIRGLVKKGFEREGMLAIATGAVRDAPDR